MVMYVRISVSEHTVADNKANCHFTFIIVIIINYNKYIINLEFSTRVGTIAHR